MKPLDKKFFQYLCEGRLFAIDWPDIIITIWLIISTLAMLGLMILGLIYLFQWQLS